MEEQKVDSLALQTFCRMVFEAMGCSETHAQTAAKNLTTADLRGVDSHGVARLSGYVRLWQQGRINTKPKFKYIRETPSTAVLDADLGLGLVAAEIAMEKAISISDKAGTGWVAVQNSNHFGIAGSYVLKAASSLKIGLAMTNASPLVAPTFGSEKLLGTNPIAIAIPAGKHKPFVADFATTVVANGKLEVKQRKGENIPLGWAQDSQGVGTTSAFALKEGGAMLPLGGNTENGGHKGYCLGAVVDIFSGVFSGANFGPWVPPFVAFLQPLEQQVGKGLGHFLGAMSIDAWQEKEEFLEKMDKWLDCFQQSKPALGHQKVFTPGQLEEFIFEDRTNNGIPLHQKVLEDLEGLAKEFKVQFSL